MITEIKKDTQLIKILLIEDNSGDVRLIREMLAEVPDVSFELESAGRLSTGLKCLAKKQPDIILLDLGLPDSQGLDTIRKIYAQAPEVPIVVLTGLDDEKIAVQAVRQGAQDYLIKGQLNGRALWRAMRYAIGRKRLEDELRESERRLKEAQALGRIGSWEFDLITQKIEWSDEVYELYERDKALGPPSAEEEALYYSPEETKRLREFARIATEIGQERKYDLQAKLPSGKTAFFSATMRPVVDDKGRVIKLFGTVQDITERKQAEKALQESEEKLRLALNATQDGLWDWDIKTGKEFFSPRWCEIIGYTFDDPELPHTYNSWASRIHPEDYNHVVKSLNSHLEKGAVYDVDYRHLHKSGEYHWQNSRGQAIFDESGKPIRMVGCIRDITERKKAEKQALVNAKLASVGELIAGVAHEINNPLTAVIGYAQLLTEMENVAPDIKEDLQKIYEESERTVKIVQNLLRFARQYKPEKNLVDINELIERALELEAYKLRTSNIELSTHLATDPPLILADYNQLQQVILNIVTNAQQAMAETKRRGKITLTTGVIEDYVRISIADNGPGISLENMTRIFDPFFTTKPAGSGSGLGLSVCHGIIAEHGGNIYAKSAPGKGTTFIIELPIATGEQAVIREKEPAKKRIRQPRRKMTGKIS